MACRFPGDLGSPSKLWDQYAQSHDEFRDPSPPTPSDGSGNDSGCFPDGVQELGPGVKSSRSSNMTIEDETLFYGIFLGVSSDVLNELDPETRMLLKTVYEATEDAGIPIESLTGGDTSVFSGFHAKNPSCPHDLGIRDSVGTVKSGMSFSSSISHLFDLRGPSMSIDTGCTSSLVCMHQACETIHAGHSQISIVGEVSTAIGDGPDSYFVGALVLKSLDAAVKNGDRVHCVMKATNVSHNGRGPTESPSTTESDGPVPGLAAIIKAALSIKSVRMGADDRGRLLPISINNPGCGGTNAEAILEEAPSLPTQLNAPTEADDTLSRVFVLSAEDGNTTRTMAKNLASHLRHTIQEGKSVSLSDLAYTLSERRSRLSCAAAVRAGSLDDLVTSLDRPEQLKIHTDLKKPRRLGFVFNGQGAQWHAMGRELLTTYPVFTSAIREADAVLRGFGADWSLEEELMRDADSTRLSEINISQPSTVALQLALVNLLRSWNIHPAAVVSHSTGEFAAAYAAGALSFSQALGVVYHLGDLARKYFGGAHAGVGGMAAAAIGAEEVEKYLANTSAGGRVVVACINSPKSITLSGDSDDLDGVLKRLDDDGIFARKLKVPLAYHSHHMLSFEAEFIKRLRQLWPSEADGQYSSSQDVVYVSPVMGAVVDTPLQVLTPEYYVRNITSPVLFSDAFKAFSHHVDDVVEIGPHSTLSGPIWEILQDGGEEQEIGYMTCLKRPVDAVQTTQDLVCDLLALGYSPSLREVNESDSKSQRLRFVPDLPTYPWNGYMSKEPSTQTEDSIPYGEGFEEVVSRSQLVWELDILHNIPDHFKDSMRIHLNQDELDREKTLTRASYYLISDAVPQLQQQSNGSLSEDGCEMMQWMMDVLDQGKRGDLGPGSTLWSRATPGMRQLLYDELEQGKHGVSGQLITRVGSELADLVRGQITTGDLARDNGELVNKYYTEKPTLKLRAYKHLFRATELFALKNPGAKVLEIGGASAGGATRAVLEAFASRSTRGGTLLGQYVFTDKDPSCLEAARQNLASWDLVDDELVAFQTLDMDQDPLEQSFAAGTFDLTVTSMALTTSSHDLRKTFLHARKLLKPGGKFFMVERVKKKLTDELVSRTLSDGVPFLSIEECNKVLKETGFTGVDFELPDCEQSQYQGSGFIMATAANTASVLPNMVSVLYTTPVPETWHEQLDRAMQVNLPGISRVEAQSWDTFELPAEGQAQEKTYILTGDMVGSGSFVKWTDEASFDKLQRLLLTSANLLWLSQGGVVDAKDPEFAVTSQFLQCFRQRDHVKRVVQLDFEKTVDGGAWTKDKIGHITNVITTAMDENLPPHEVDWEYAVKDGMLHVPRIVPILDGEADSPDAEDTGAESPNAEMLLADTDSTVLIAVNGGLTANEISREVAASMAALGARNLIILGKDIEGHSNAESLLNKSEAGNNCNVEVLDCDLSSESDLVALLKDLEASNMPPIRGVAVVEDSMTFDVISEEEATRPSLGQWTQAVETRASCLKTLDAYLPPGVSFFLVLSLSGGSLDNPSGLVRSAVGGTFQSHVVTGRPVSTIHLDLGGVNEGGERTNVLTTVLKDAIRRPPTSPRDGQIIVGLPQWDKIPPEAPMRRDRRFGTLRLGVPRNRRAAVLASEARQATSPADLLVQALEAGEGNEVTVASALQAQLAVLLRIQSVEEIDPSKPLATYGVDSIVAIEVRTWLAYSTDGKAKLSVLEILNAGSLYDVAKMIKARAGKGQSSL
ncbi:hypothetical protein QBC37DRAFT_459218 [Rhypophila decipiens]|uniref:Uncharacterized protein n=1 Tax=Rhypophila decipiens TaxID=261697 RepID=A0AAN6YC90_9PEZI|nr:hypothetical protein QBC37DRAFT_459218 [Rhypophila decipiens]